MDDTEGNQGSSLGSTNWEEWLRESQKELLKRKERRDEQRQQQRDGGLLPKWLRVQIWKLGRCWRRRQSADDNTDGDQNDQTGNREVSTVKSLI